MRIVPPTITRDGSIAAIKYRGDDDWVALACSKTKQMLGEKYKKIMDAVCDAGLCEITDIGPEDIRSCTACTGPLLKTHAPQCMCCGAHVHNTCIARRPTPNPLPWRCETCLECPECAKPVELHASGALTAATFYCSSCLHLYHTSCLARHQCEMTTAAPGKCHRCMAIIRPEAHRLRTLVDSIPDTLVHPEIRRQLVRIDSASLDGWIPESDTDDVMTSIDARRIRRFLGTAYGRYINTEKYVGCSYVEAVEHIAETIDATLS